MFCGAALIRKFPQKFSALNFVRILRTIDFRLYIVLVFAEVNSFFLNSCQDFILTNFKLYEKIKRLQSKI